MGKPSSTAPPAPSGFDSADYLAKNPDVASFAGGPAAHYQQFGQAEGRQGGFAPQVDPFAEFFASFGGGGQEQNNFQSSESRAAELEQRREEDRLEQGRQDTETAYGDYLSASELALGNVNSEIEKERANAALLGVQFDINEEQKTERISNRFASIFTAGDQQNLDRLFSEFGAPSGFNGFTVTRGDSPTEAEAPSDESSIATSRGVTPKKRSLSSDEDLLGSSSSLG